MSVYTELLRLGMDDEAARTVADVASEGTVTKQYLDLRLAQFESRLAWKMGGLVITAMIGQTAIFALIVMWLQP